VERFLQAGLPVLSMAPVSSVGPERLREVLAADARRLREEATPDQMGTSWRATTILLSLRYSTEQVEEIVREVATMSMGIRGIEESWLYQDYFQKGKAEGEAEGELDRARKDLIRVGRKTLGAPDESVWAEIHLIEDLDRLDWLLERVFDVSTWRDLLAPPAP
jgi:hypothetical protein